MRVAWFRTEPFPSRHGADHAAGIVTGLAQTLTIDVVTGARADDFVAEHTRRPYDVCVFELRNAPGSEFIWPFLFQYPGVLLLSDRSLHDARARTLEQRRRIDDYEAEFVFNHGHPSPPTARPFGRGGWPMLRAPLHASRLVVVEDEARRIGLEAAYPGVQFRDVPPYAVGPLSLEEDVSVSEGTPLRVALLGTTPEGTTHRHRVERAVQRARDGGTDVVLLPPTDPPLPFDGRADVVVVLDPLTEEPSMTPALGAMAHRRAVIVLEREATAIWPALDPQTWRARDAVAQRPPVVVSLDPRDEEHSLMLALKGLADDLPRRRTLGAAARAWWLAHGTPENAAKEWLRVLEEAARTPSPDRPVGWPAHLDVEGMASQS